MCRLKISCRIHFANMSRWYLRNTVSWNAYQLVSRRAGNLETHFHAEFSYSGGQNRIVHVYSTEQFASFVYTYNAVDSTQHESSLAQCGSTV